MPLNVGGLDDALIERDWGELPGAFAKLGQPVRKRRVDSIRRRGCLYRRTSRTERTSSGCRYRASACPERLHIRRHFRGRRSRSGRWQRRGLPSSDLPSRPPGRCWDRSTWRSGRYRRARTRRCRWSPLPRSRRRPLCQRIHPSGSSSRSASPGALHRETNIRTRYRRRRLKGREGRASPGPAPSTTCLVLATARSRWVASAFRHCTRQRQPRLPIRRQSTGPKALSHRLLVVYRRAEACSPAGWSTISGWLTRNRRRHGPGRIALPRNRPFVEQEVPPRSPVLAV